MSKKSKDKGINPELEKAISELLRATMLDPLKVFYALKQIKIG